MVDGKIRYGYGKWILRQLAINKLPGSIVHNRSKQAFALNPHHWLRDGLGQYIFDGIKDRTGDLADIFSPQKSRRTDATPFTRVYSSW